MPNCRFRLPLDVSLYQDVALQVTILKMIAEISALASLYADALMLNFFTSLRRLKISFANCSDTQAPKAWCQSWFHCTTLTEKTSEEVVAEMLEAENLESAKFYVFCMSGWWCVNHVQQHPEWSRWVREIGRLGDECSTWFHPPIFRVAIHWLCRVTGV